MKRNIFGLFLICILCSIFISCSNQTDADSCPRLKIVSNYTGYIYRIGLVGYSFDDLMITNNESKTFELTNGIPGGNEKVHVSLSFRPDKIHSDSNSPASAKCNFQDGKTTVIKLSSSGTLTVSYE